jgi:NitT/TauT family transport system ATP-binding protein
MKVICRNISKTFATRKGQTPALDNVNLECADGEFLCIVGPSGCGKTTLLKIIAGLVKPSEGDISLEGDAAPVLQPAAMVFQGHGLFPWMNIVDNVCYSFEVKNVSREERYRRADPLLEKIGLSKFRKHYPHQLSEGMKQRAGLARALVSGAPVLLMDEPFAALDAQMRRILQDQLMEVHRELGRSIIYVTHDVEEAILMGDRILLMTHRPGHIKNEFRIGFPRPRDAGGEFSAEILKIKNDIWGQIKEEVEKSMELP